MRIAICDDNQLFCQQLIALLRQEEEIVGQFEIQKFSSEATLLKQIKQNVLFDLIFLGLTAEHEKSSLETAEQIRRYDRAVMLVFVTADRNGVWDAFAMQAAPYLIKPVDKQQVQCVLKCYRLNRLDEEYRLPFRIRNQKGQEEILLVQGKDILYVESYLRKLQVYCSSGHSFEAVGKISELEAQLGVRGFFRIHKSYLVNLKYLKRIEPEQLWLQEDGEQTAIALPLSRRKREKLRKILLSEVSY